MMMLALVFLLIALTMFQYDQSSILEWHMTSINSAYLSIPIIIDSKGMLFMFTVSYISFNVLIFSKAYMFGDMNITRFTHLVMMFILSMMILILTPNMMTMLLGWDGLGITSFLLVIYYQNKKSLNSGMITLMTNRIGDCLILLSIAIIMSQGHWNFLFMWKDTISNPNLLTMMILVAAMTKSAQFPFMAWLTCAMAAPTPVSALVHSSTLVTAGVFLLIRFYEFLSEFTYFNLILLTSGLITMYFGGLWAVTKKDIKITVALSTLSQLGLMMSTLALGMVDFCFFHLLTHAMFKATMFMSVGMAIMFKHHRQHMANIKFKRNSRTTGIALMVSLLSMNAIFFFAGYYSKDLILEDLAAGHTSFAVWMMFFASTWITATYSTRIWRSTITTKAFKKIFFFRNNWGNAHKLRRPTNNIKVIEFPLMMMTLASLVMGSVIMWLAINPGEMPIIPKRGPTQIVWLTPILGATMAAFFCPSNKSKLPWRPPFNWAIRSITSYKDLMMKNITFNPNITFRMTMVSKFNTNPTWARFVKHVVNFSFSSLSDPLGQKKGKHPPVKFAKQSLESGRSLMKKKQIAQTVLYTFKLKKYFITLSLKIEKYLDQGIFNFIGPSTLKNYTPWMSEFTLSIQKNKTPSLLLMTMMLMIFMLPLIMYDNLLHF
uniref:NADH-ubiquinone oxidoreductase chain 5 n=1 Tax=Typosyllis antoni TaxID=1898412 RepID=A0A1C9UZG5_9ANNE|nr:NADH dehydrogenase subunit 5 [Typosyllis antoni]AOR87154.1 NADH dehydrogenase subunit 5 [Typosyllis antoni]